MSKLEFYFKMRFWVVDLIFVFFLLLTFTITQLILTDVSSIFETIFGFFFGTLFSFSIKSLWLYVFKRYIFIHDYISKTDCNSERDMRQMNQDINTKIKSVLQKTAAFEKPQKNCVNKKDLCIYRIFFFKLFFGGNKKQTKQQYQKKKKKYLIIFFLL